MTAFSRRIDELEGAGDVAYLRGADSVAFTYEKNAARTEQQNLSVLRRGPDGRWRISRMMWGTRT